MWWYKSGNQGNLWQKGVVGIGKRFQPFQILIQGENCRGKYVFYRITWILLDISFLNSILIHEDKTKKITTVEEVWICDLN
jgi:hypothetical protein